MKETVLVYAGALFLFFPWMIGIVDIVTWALFGSKWTDIPWSGSRGALLVFWPLLWAALLTLAVVVFHT